MADDGLAYGDYHGKRGGGQGGGGGSGGGGDRGIFGDALSKFKNSQSSGGLFGKLTDAVQDIGNELAGRLSDVRVGAQTATGGAHRFGSFSSPREGNEAKWYVDGCGYFWAVSEAMSHARETIWILDWWLSPELYLRRPPAKNEQYRLDRMLKAAAERGVSVNVIVYKEVEQALRLSSEYTKTALEALHPNIKVFRHPDHAPDAQSFLSGLKTTFMSAQTLAKLPEDTLKTVYGMNEDVILYWAHHEKLCLIDGEIAFMGGLDLCYGRWDTNQHPIADVHPENLDDIVYPGQDYNNARLMDFQNVAQPENNKLDRTKSSRMGWSDVSISLRGPITADLEAHFVQRWNFIYYRKYNIRSEDKYKPLYLEGTTLTTGPGIVNPGNLQQPGHQPGFQQFQQPHESQQYQQPQQGQQTQTQQPQQHNLPGGQQTSQTGSTPYFPPPPGSSQHDSSQHYPPPPPGGPPAQSQQNFPPPPPGGPPKHDQENYPPPPPGGPPKHDQQSFPPPPLSGPQQGSQQYYPPPPSGGPPPDQGPQSQGVPYFPPPPGSSEGTRGVGEEAERGLFSDLVGSSGRGSSSHGPTGQGGQGDSGHGYSSRLQELEGKGYEMAGKLEHRMKHAYNDYSKAYAGRKKPQYGVAGCQLTRSCAQWSNGTDLEHSVQNAYVDAIRSSQHFIYIENQFFITATSPKQAPVRNKIGAAIVERAIRAAKAGQKWKCVVVIPSVPGFAGDLRDESSLGTRAIMDFQYKAICRGGYSIMEEIDKAGYNPMEYIRFYNLRNYDRINNNKKLKDMEKSVGITYEAARREADELMDPIGRRAQDGVAKDAQPASYNNYKKYQEEAKASQTLQSAGRWDTVSECCMLGGTDIRQVPWEGDPESEINSFVSEELYIHTKVMIVDDRIVICGSANLNDRSQLGDHDSEIAMVVEDQDPIDSYMNGRPWKAGRFAATLRRQLFRKHLGLIKPQNMMQPDRNFQPVGVPNEYDFGSPEDHLVQDPLADTFLNFWNSRARRNTDAFRKVFRPVPDDSVLTWKDYTTFYEQFFQDADAQATGKETVAEFIDPNKRPKYMWGHVVAGDFKPGAEGLAEVKECLSTIKGTLVEMPLRFLIKEDIARQGLTLNAITEPVYT